jgi:transcriptional regulator with XRE-family HTH domain
VIGAHRLGDIGAAAVKARIEPIHDATDLQASRQWGSSAGEIALVPPNAIHQQPDVDMKASGRRRELGQFLQARRATLKPADLGLKPAGRRRAPGLRREEVASIAGIGITWYTWLEQGRDIGVSIDMLQRLSRALRLSPHDAAYVFTLAGHRPPETSGHNDSLDVAFQAAVDGFTIGPAVVYDSLGTVLAFNRFADFLYRFDESKGPRARNLVWQLFMDPSRKQLYVDWLDFSIHTTGLLRAVYAEQSSNSDLVCFLEDLRSASTDFDRLWKSSARKGTSSFAPSPLRFRVPVLGILTFIFLRLSIPTRPGWWMVLAPPADERTASAVRQGVTQPSAATPQRNAITPDVCTSA